MPRTASSHAARLRPRGPRLSLALTLGLSFWATPFHVLAAPAPLMARATEDDLGKRNEALLATLRNGQAEPPQRNAAALALLTQCGAEGIEMLRAELASSAESGTLRAICCAVATSPAEPPRELAAALQDVLLRVEPALAPQAAAAIGRYDDHLLVRKLADVAQDAKADPDRRRAAVLALGYRHSASIARLLMALIEPDNPAAVRQAAFDALARTTGVSELGGDLGGWRQWWDVHQRLTPARWDSMVLDNITRRLAAMERQDGRVVDKLVDAQAQLYRASGPNDRPALIIAMLADPLELVRRLGMDLLDQRIRAGEPISADLKKSLVARLDDPSAFLRVSAARLLRNQRDEVAGPDRGADAIASRLSDPHEQDTDVLRAYLQVMADQPRAAAVDRAVKLLQSHPELRDAAAGALTPSAIDAGLTDHDQLVGLKSLLRRLAPDDRPPEPKVIELLGRVGEEEDWTRIARWLDRGDEAVKVAAARTWAQSDRQPVAFLARHASTPAVWTIAIDAATRRGRDLETISALLAVKPAQDQQLIDAWQRALVAVGGRVSLADAVKADADLASRKESDALRVAFLGAAIAAPIDAGSDPRSLASLALARAQVLLTQGNTAQAMVDLARLSAIAASLDPAQQARLDSLRLSAMIAAGDADDAFRQADRMIDKTAAAPDAARRRTLAPQVALFLDWAERSLATKQTAQAGRIVKHLRDRLSVLMAPAEQARLQALETSLAALSPPAAPVTPATQPATETASPPPVTPVAVPVSTTGEAPAATRP